MARIALGNFVTDIRGTLGNHVFSSWRGVSYIRRKPAGIVNPNTPAQAAQRLAFGEASTAWRALTAAQRGGWDALSQELASVAQSDGHRGVRRIIPDGGDRFSGFNMYLRAAGYQASVGGARVDDAPVGSLPPSMCFNVAVNDHHEVGPPVVDAMEVTWQDPAENFAAGEVRVWGKSQGMLHPKILAVVAKGLGLATITQIDYGNGVPQAVLAGTYDFQIDAVNTDTGLRGGPSAILPLVYVVGP